REVGCGEALACVAGGVGVRKHAGAPGERERAGARAERALRERHQVDAAPRVSGGGRAQQGDADGEHGDASHPANRTTPGRKGECVAMAGGPQSVSATTVIVTSACRGSCSVGKSPKLEYLAMVDAPPDRRIRASGVSKMKIRDATAADIPELDRLWRA